MSYIDEIRSKKKAFLRNAEKEDLIRLAAIVFDLIENISDKRIRNHSIIVQIYNLLSLVVNFETKVFEQLKDED